MPPRQPVSIIVLNFNGLDYLNGCLDSILAQDYPTFEVIFVDNASSDGSADYVEEHFPPIRVLRNAENLGFAQGNNRGVDMATHDLIVLLNNDVIVDPGWLSGLVDAISEPEVALASSLVRTAGIRELFYERNGTVNFLGHNVMLAFEEPTDIFSCTGCSVIFRKSEFGHPFDPDYFAYAEDVYLGLRARFAGRKVRHTNESRLFHFGGGTASKQRSAFISFYQERNRLLNSLLFFSPWTLVRLLPYFAFNAAAKTGHGLLKARKGLPGVLRSFVWLHVHPRVILRKRREIQANKIVEDREVLAVMSCKLLDSESAPARILNKGSELYCRLVGIRTLEHGPPSPLLTELRQQMQIPGETVEAPPLS